MILQIILAKYHKMPFLFFFCYFGVSHNAMQMQHEVLSNYLNSSCNEMHSDIIIKKNPLMAFSLWDLGSVGGLKIYHMGLIINLNNVQTGCCDFLDPQSHGCENISLFIFLLLQRCMF